MNSALNTALFANVSPAPCLFCALQQAFFPLQLISAAEEELNAKEAASKAGPKVKQERSRMRKVGRRAQQCLAGTRGSGLCVARMLSPCPVCAVQVLEKASPESYPPLLERTIPYKAGETTLDVRANSIILRHDAPGVAARADALVDA